MGQATRLISIELIKHWWSTSTIVHASSWVSRIVGLSTRSIPESGCSAYSGGARSPLQLQEHLANELSNRIESNRWFRSERASRAPRGCWLCDWVSGALLFSDCTWWSSVSTVSDGVHEVIDPLCQCTAFLSSVSDSVCISFLPIIRSKGFLKRRVCSTISEPDPAKPLSF